MSNFMEIIFLNSSINKKKLWIKRITKKITQESSFFGFLCQKCKHYLHLKAIVMVFEIHNIWFVVGRWSVCAYWTRIVFSCGKWFSNTWENFKQERRYKGQDNDYSRRDDEEEIGKGNDLIEDSATGSKDAVDASQQIVLAHINKKLSICVCVFFPARWIFLNLFVFLWRYASPYFEHVLIWQVSLSYSQKNHQR